MYVQYALLTQAYCSLTLWLLFHCYYVVIVVCGFGIPTRMETKGDTSKGMCVKNL